MSEAYVGHLENEVRLPGPELCMALAQALELTPEDQQKLLDAVESAHLQRAEQRIRTRGAAMRGALQTRGGEQVSSAAPPGSETSAEDIAREVAADPDLQAAYRNLSTALSDPQMRGTVLSALEAFARAARPTTADSE